MNHEMVLNSVIRVKADKADVFLNARMLRYANVVPHIMQQHELFNINSQLMSSMVAIRDRTAVNITHILIL